MAENFIRSILRKTGAVVRPLWSFLTRYWARVVILTCIGLYVSEKLDQTGSWLSFRYQIFQALQFVSPRPAQPQRTALVLINDDDHYGPELQGRSPTQRDYLARVVTALSDANAAVIALDFNFASPSPTGNPIEEPQYRTETDALRNAIFNAAKAGRKIVLTKSIDKAADHVFAEESDVYGPDPASWKNVSTGYDALPDDVRNLPLRVKSNHGGFLESFALAVARSENAASLENIPDLSATYYAGFLPEKKFKAVVSAGDLLRGKTDMVTTKVVFVSGKWREFAKDRGPIVPAYDSPVGELPGVFFHANYFEALYDARIYRVWEGRLKIAAEAVLSILVALSFYFTLSSKIKALGLYLFPYFIILLITYVSLISFGWFFDPLIPTVVIGAHGVLEQIHRWRKSEKSKH